MQKDRLAVVRNPVTRQPPKAEIAFAVRAKNKEATN